MNPTGGRTEARQAGDICGMCFGLMFMLSCELLQQRVVEVNERNRVVSSWEQGMLNLRAFALCAMCMHHESV